MSVVFDVTFYPYCGGGYFIEQDCTKSEARAIAARRLNLLRSDSYPTTTLISGCKWEIEEPEDCFFVPDECGILEIQSRDVYDEYECDFWEDYELLAS